MPFNTQPPYSVEHVSNLIASRALDTDYINTTGRTIYVNVTVYCMKAAFGDDARIWGEVDTVQYAQAGFEAQAGSSPIIAMVCLYFPVKAGSSYKVGKYTTGGGSCVLQNWIESW